MNTSYKKWYLSRTVWLAVLQGIAGILSIVAFENPEIGEVLMAKSVIDILLRFATSYSIKKSY